jgi:hypothetical protein
MLLPDDYDVSTVPPDVLDLFETLTFKIIATGRIRYSARAILHRIRWHYHIDKGIREFKCNDHWTPHMARWFMAQYPEHEGFFELRASPGEYALL